MLISKLKMKNPIRQMELRPRNNEISKCLSSYEDIELDDYMILEMDYSSRMIGFV